MWASSKVKEKEKFQKLVFPEGIYLDSENMSVRTSKVNSVFELIHMINKGLDENKNEKNLDFSRLVELMGELSNLLIP